MSRPYFCATLSSRQMKICDALKMKRGVLVKAGLVLVVLTLLVLVFVGYVIRVPYATTRQTLSNRSIGEIFGAREIGQIFKSDKANLSAFGFQFATFGDRVNNKEVFFELRQNPEDKEALRTVKINANILTDHKMYEFKFDPIADSVGKKYYASVRSPESVEGNAITIDYRNSDVYGGIDNSLVVLQDGRGNSFTNAKKPDRDVAFMVYHNISGLEFAKLTGVRAIKDFVLSLKNQRGEYERATRFMSFAVLLTAVILFYRNRLETVLSRKKYFWIFIFILIMGGVGLRLLYVNQMPFTNDEGFYLYDARTVLQGKLPGGDAIAKAPIFVGATAISTAVFGNIINAGRFVSLICGVLTAWPLFILGKRIGGKRAGIFAGAIWLLTGAPALFNSYGHTQSIQMLFSALALALLIIAQEKKKWQWFVFAGIILGISIVARKSSLALGLPIIFILLMDKVTWKKRFINIVVFGLGMLAVLVTFLGIIFELYGKTGVLYATGLSLAKESITQLGDRGDLYATYSVNGILPFFREALPLIFLAFVMLGQFLERLLVRVNWLLARFAWIVPLILVAGSKYFIDNFESKARLSPGVGVFWVVMSVIIILLAIFPLRRKEKDVLENTGWQLLPLIWFLAIAIFYAVWIKFTANYIAEFLPALSLMAVFGAKWLADNFQGRKFALTLVAIVLVWANYSSAENSFKFNHTGTFHWSAILESAEYLKENVPKDALVQTGAVAIPYVSGHHVPYDAAHPTWYAYGFIEPELRNVFMASSEKMVDAVLNNVNWFVLDKVTEFSYFLEYPMIEKDVTENYTLLKTIENYSNPIRIYKRK